MGKYTDDDITIIDKKEIARLQLEDSIKMFLEERYFSAITLAGAADGIFCGIIQSTGEASPGDKTWQEIEYFRGEGIPLAGNISKKEAFRTWNLYRNALKHHDAEKDDDHLEIFPIDEAYEWIERAVHSGKVVGVSARNYDQLQARVIPWFFLENGM